MASIHERILAQRSIDVGIKIQKELVKVVVNMIIYWIGLMKKVVKYINKGFHPKRIGMKTL